MKSTHRNCLFFSSGYLKQKQMSSARPANELVVQANDWADECCDLLNATCVDFMHFHSLVQRASDESG